MNPFCKRCAGMQYRIDRMQVYNAQRFEKECRQDGSGNRRLEVTQGYTASFAGREMVSGADYPKQVARPIFKNRNKNSGAAAE